ncbi:GNAT family N-acetyltransferase [Marinibaculum pumilum]|uniref:GNAT family N-acetyltransferase n=1 Tax=Marinibaculum pumilum TaxID=1766165 RepID=A0ABV7L9C3_9PROT
MDTAAAPRRNDRGQPVGTALPDWQPRPPPPRTAMAGRFCRIEPLDPARHGDELFDAFAADVDGSDWTYLGYGPFDGRTAFRGWLDGCTADDPLFHTIIDSASGHATGMAAFMRIDPAMGVVEIGHIHLAPALQRRPAATEAMFLFMARVFDELGYRRFEWKCDSLNAPSRRAALRLGFSYEGLFRQALVYKGRNRDTAWYAMTDGDWPSRKAAFQAWLDPANFDADGRQRRGLAELRSAQSPGD